MFPFHPIPMHRPGRCNAVPAHQQCGRRCRPVLPEPFSEKRGLSRLSISGRNTHRPRGRSSAGHRRHDVTTETEVPTRGWRACALTGSELGEPHGPGQREGPPGGTVRSRSSPFHLAPALAHRWCPRLIADVPGAGHFGLEGGDELWRRWGWPCCRHRQEGGGRNEVRYELLDALDNPPEERRLLIEGDQASAGRMKR